MKPSGQLGSLTWTRLPHSFVRSKEKEVAASVTQTRLGQDVFYISDDGQANVAHLEGELYVALLKETPKTPKGNLMRRNERHDIMILSEYGGRPQGELARFTLSATTPVLNSRYTRRAVAEQQRAKDAVANNGSFKLLNLVESLPRTTSRLVLSTRQSTNEALRRHRDGTWSRVVVVVVVCDHW